MILPFKASVARLSPQADSDKEMYITINPSITIDIQPASNELVAISEGKLGETFLAFTSYSGLAVSDKITISGMTDSYKVRGISNWNYGPLPHFELTLFKGDDNVN